MARSDEKLKERQRNPDPGLYVAYLTGKGMARQRKAMRDYLKSRGVKVVVYREFTDFEEAMRELRMCRCALLVATLDVFAPAICPFMTLLESVKVEVCDLPDASDLVLQVKMIVRHEEQRLRNVAAAKKLKRRLSARSRGRPQRHNPANLPTFLIASARAHGERAARQLPHIIR